MDNPDVWMRFGIHLPDLLAGFAGGVVNVFALRRTEPFLILGSLIAGALMANYLGDMFSQYVFGAKELTADFVIGVVGMGIATGIIESSRSWRPFSTNKGANNGSNSKPNPPA